MALESRLDLKVSQKLILTPQLQQAIKLLQMPQLELAQSLNMELMENPFLEEMTEAPEEHEQEKEREEYPSDEAVPAFDDPEAPFENLINFGADEYFDERSSDGRDLGYFSPDAEEQPSYELFYSKKTDLPDHLLWQLRMSTADDEVRKAAEVVIANLDDDGYLRATEEELAPLVGADGDTIAQAISLVQSFDPSGVGARSLKECLLLQIATLDLGGSLAEKIVTFNMDDLQKKKYSTLARQYTVELQDVLAAVKVVEGLEPRPGRSFSIAETTYVVPDVFIIKTEEGYQISLNDDGMPRLRLNSTYRRLLKNRESLSKEETEFLREKLRLATELIKSLDQRNRTIYKVSECIVKFQEDFFEKGIKLLKPLNLKDVASYVGMHESTISRVTSNKYLACNHGVFSFRFFFSSAIKSENGTISSTSVKDLIKEIIAGEDPKAPLSDQMLADLLKKRNIDIARRTVAKYREELRIPSQSQRKKYD
ncbi:MAG: RNA polymerase factor sigma-54 [Nitrospirales bacterium]|nr:RNA polymerase factor sigma-54 [Nitrospirales bacterium]